MALVQSEWNPNAEDLEVLEAWNSDGLLASQD